MTSLSRDVRSAQAWNVLPELDVGSKLLALGLYWDKDARAIISIKCKYALQTKGERVSRHLGDKHDIPPTVRKGGAPTPAIHHDVNTVYRHCYRGAPERLQNHGGFFVLRERTSQIYV